MHFNIFEPCTSPVDWCESNYAVSTIIAEFFNTVSNVLFFVVPVIMMYLFRDYGKSIGKGIHIIWIMMIFVGISSTYFHASLSFAGQLLDELSILWLYTATFIMLFPRRLYPDIFNNDRKRLAIVCIFVSTIVTGLALIQPALNAFVLMTLVIPTFIVLVDEVNKQKNLRIKKLAVRCFISWCLAVFCWINDRLLCRFWTGIGFPYLHALWHIFICITTYTAVVLFTYFAACEEHANKQPLLGFWPDNGNELGIPYLIIK